MKIELIVNGAPRTVEAHPGTLLSEWLAEPAVGPALGVEPGGGRVAVEGVEVSPSCFLLAQAHGRALQVLPRSAEACEEHPLPADCLALPPSGRGGLAGVSLGQEPLDLR